MTKLKVSIIYYSLFMILCALFVIYYSLFSGHTDIAQYLIKHGADVHCKNASGLNI